MKPATQNVDEMPHRHVSRNKISGKKVQLEKVETHEPTCYQTLSAQLDKISAPLQTLQEFFLSSICRPKNIDKLICSKSQKSLYKKQSTIKFYDPHLIFIFHSISSLK